MKVVVLSLRWLLARLYRIEVRGREHLHGLGDKVMVISNHTSFLDALLLYLFLPFPLTFAINPRQHERFYVRAFKRWVMLFPVEPTNPLSIRALIHLLDGGGHVVIFPEGRITVTGALMKIYNGPGLVAIKSGAEVLPVAIHGAQYTPFSRLKGKVRLRWFPRITLTIMAPRTIVPPAELHGRDQREYAGQQLTDLMTDMVFQAGRSSATLFERLLDARQVHGGGHVVVEDIQRQPLSYNGLLMRALLLGDKLNAETNAQEVVGVLLPNMAGTLATFWGLLAHGRVPAMLNYTVGVAGMISACETAGVKAVVSSRQFVERAELQQVVATLATRVKVIYLEDLATQISLGSKLGAYFCSRNEQLIRSVTRPAADPDSAAVILFTSGSEGVPKGVVLSHRNLSANVQQITTMFDFNANDVVLNALPLFHTFGLTGGGLLAPLSGMRVFLYPSPLHYRVIPEVAYDINATVLFGTSTFLAGYGKAAHPYDFYSMRYVVAGAEKLKDEVRLLWQQKFGVRVLEGYGVTECSPVICANTPMACRAGTVGRLFPGIESHLEAVPGIAEGGRLHVRGPNVMLGYMLHDNPGRLQPTRSNRGEGWYDTGDIVSINSDGFITIQGRAKRFAKIAGEMVSLTVVENIASRLWPEALHAAIAIADENKGERIILITNAKKAERSAMAEQARRDGVGELCLPRTVMIVKEVPVLGTGKIDYVTIGKNLLSLQSQE